ncbi:hypothetical protein B0920_16110 [Massilia sp. KIM]|uniref:hypothetical protein n=1 Tax=Massilia sp. KIM TaxID=1955422 RepID=UPI00098F712F|nr:hypothetical protein [Massilia sp. KIM]OON60506.1 hypothetical protein B0920_16110 [Massilia sp. KIM]
MKSVTFSEIVRIHQRPGYLRRTATWRQSLPWALTMLAGLPVLVMALHLIDPATPLPYVVLPAVLGALVPLCMLGPGRFEMRTRFDAHYMISTLDEALAALGYRKSGDADDSIRYTRSRPWLRSQDGAITVAVQPHALEVIGPVGSLRLLQHRIAR